ncbi:hypothetical protein LJR166_002867 [Acidovorax delafieldii]
MPFPPALHPSTNVALRKVIAPLLLWMLALGLGLHTGASHATTQNATQSGHSEVSKKKKSTKVKQQRSSSEESRSERDRRLYRECKGRANAGACLGYTHKP